MKRILSAVLCCLLSGCGGYKYLNQARDPKGPQSSSILFSVKPTVTLPAGTWVDQYLIHINSQAGKKGTPGKDRKFQRYTISGKPDGQGQLLETLYLREVPEGRYCLAGVEVWVKSQNFKPFPAVVKFECNETYYDAEPGMLQPLGEVKFTSDVTIETTGAGSGSRTKGGVTYRDGPNVHLELISAAKQHYPTWTEHLDRAEQRLK